MASQKRIHTVSDGNSDRLVRATTRAQALAHVAHSVFQTRVATQDDLVVALEAGVKVEDAKAEPEPGAESEKGD